MFEISFITGVIQQVFAKYIGDKFFPKNGKREKEEDCNVKVKVTNKTERGATEIYLEYDDMESLGGGGFGSKGEKVRWVREIANKGIAKAQYNLGVMYSKGEDVEKSDREAFRWYKLAAYQGSAKAQNNLGARYGKGKGIVQDKRDAYIWLLIAQASGSEKASQNFQEISWQEILTSEEIKSAENEAKRRFEGIEMDRKNKIAYAERVED